MVRLCTLVVVAMAYVRAHGFASPRSDGSICDDLGKKGRMMDRLYQSVIGTELPDVGTLSLKVTDDDDLLLSILLVKKIPASRVQEFIAGARNTHERRRSYEMAHFRWGKPSGRKRRPVRVYASPQAGGGPPESRSRPKARRQLNRQADDAKGSLNGGSHRVQASLRARVGSESHVRLSPQQRRNGSYQMTHFRWGRPSVTKRKGNFGKTWAGRPPNQLTRRLGKMTVKDAQRIIGRMDDRQEGEGQVLV